MKVKVRHIDNAEAVDFTECDHDGLNGVISFVMESGGIYHDGDLEPFYGYQLVLDDLECYAEIMIGKD